MTTRKQGKQHQRGLTVRIECVPTRDAEARLSRVLDILVKAAKRAGARSRDSVDAKKEKPPDQAPADDALTGGVEGDDSREPA